jgi:adenylate cyclase class 2
MAKKLTERNNHREIEVRFLDIEVPALNRRLKKLGGADGGEKLLSEIIFYDKKLIWRDGTPRKFIRLRSDGERTMLAFKEAAALRADGTIEIEVSVGDLEKTALILEEAGLIAFRRQEKKRHSWRLGPVTVDIDTWPLIPTFVELEGTSERDLKKAAEKLRLDWKRAEYRDARRIIEEVYGIPVGKYRLYTFKKSG